MVAALLVLAGCATNKNDWSWYKSGSTQRDFNMDDGQCRAQALSGTGGRVTMGTLMIMQDCMMGKGWEKRPNS